MKNYTCLYSIEYLDSNNNVKTGYGLLYVDNFVEAVTQLEEDLYGNDLIKINEIELFDTSAYFTKEVYALVKKELEQGVS